MTVKRLAKILVLLALKATGFFALARSWHRRCPRILCYHGVWLGADGFAGDSMFIDAQTFERRLAFLRERSFSVISLDDAVEGLAGRKRLPDDAVVITIDDGWYSTYAEMLPALKRHNMPATIYCDTANLLAGGSVPRVAARYLLAVHRPPAGRESEVQDALDRATYLGLERKVQTRALQDLAALLRVDLSRYEKNRAFAYMTAEQLAEAHKAGFAIELHTHTHSLHGFEPRLMEQEIETNRAVLSRLLSRPAASFRHFCYPSGVASPAARQVLQRLGVVSATTLKSRLVNANDDPLLLPRILDGQHLSELEFEVAICGLGGIIRNAIFMLRRRITTLLSIGAAKRYYRPTAYR